METSIDLLKKYWRKDTFRPMQKEVIDYYNCGHDTIVLLPTGGGKSLCYQLPAVMKKGVTLVICPIISIMQDQIIELGKKGIKAMFFESGYDKNSINRQFDNARYGNYKLIYFSPERLLDKIFLNQLKTFEISGIAIDEAHCVSEWGNDFRPAFKTIKKIKKILPEVPIMALSASATPKVIMDMTSDLGMKDPKVFKTSFERKNIKYQVIFTENKIELIINTLHDYKESCIIYCKTRIETEKTTIKLKKAGINCDYFHGGLDKVMKKQKLESWKREQTLIIVATSAFGMGIDKGNVRKVFHLTIPESLESYYQETGRAGRDGKPSSAMLLVKPQNKTNHYNKFIKYLPVKKELKTYFKNLCNYLRIPHGEGQGMQFNLNLKDFCETYQYQEKKILKYFEIFDREGIFEFQNFNKSMTFVKLSCSHNEAIERIKRNDSGGKLIQFLMRNFEGIFTSEKKINLNEISDIIRVKEGKIDEQLKLLKNQKIIELVSTNTDVKIYWKKPREDDFILNMVSKKQKTYNELKKVKIKKMLDFTFDLTTCKRNFILSYFGEERKEKCKNCSAESCIGSSE
tara:strand:+ start:13333 stop:15048 length:1716 start_codon:yes stop_codon:yes gene_type:complete